MRASYDQCVAGTMHRHSNQAYGAGHAASRLLLQFPAKYGLYSRLERVSFYFSFLSAAVIVISIAASQIFLGVAVLALLGSRKRLRYPPFTLLLCLFFIATVVAVLLSGDAYTGLPQIRKFYVCLIALVLFNTLETVGQIGLIMLAWAAGGLLSALYSLLQFYHRYQQAHLLNANDYGFYLDGRIKGFAGHWMTFGGEEMIVLLLLLSFLFFAPHNRLKWLVGACATVIWLSIVLGLTRSIFLLGVPIGVAYLLWNWKKWSLAALAIAATFSFAVAPVQVRERVTSVVHPHLRLDSNNQRILTRRTGWRMIKAHPWFGLGPEQVGKQFVRYLPPDVSLPLPKGYYGHLHNIYLQYAAERGIPAMLLMMWLIAKALRDFREPLNSSMPPDIRYFLHGAVAVILALLAEGFFEYNLGDSEVLTMFFVVLTCGYFALEKAEPILLPKPAA
jgi:putative inorganic carbon (HCO3(-)) transporter